MQWMQSGLESFSLLLAEWWWERLVGEETSSSPHMKGLFTLFWFFFHVRKGAKQATGAEKGSQFLGIVLISRTQTLGSVRTVMPVPQFPQL